MVHFFLETVFADARPELREGLERVMALYRALPEVSLSEQLVTAARTPSGAA